MLDVRLLCCQSSAPGVGLVGSRRQAVMYALVQCGTCEVLYKDFSILLNMPCKQSGCGSTLVLFVDASCREVETLFHEFGHALQHMLTTVNEGLVAGIRWAG
eukprot:GHUV01045097.1.p1 GENE.GHUV01045097.1~~GHUV01045097.1.p1  ORF type:complete len:102 (-),score=22.99 GHUV01045097.1:151-456(-)